MNLKAHFVAALVVVCFLAPESVRAMTIQDFTRMDLDDEATYTTLLVEGTAKMLKANGHPDQAQQTINLFKDTSKNGGVNQLAMNLKDLNARNNHNAINPNNRVPNFIFEDAFARTLSGAGIEVPVASLLAIGNGFTPAGPPRSHLPEL